MIQSIATNIWHAQYKFTAAGLPVSTRMTIVRLKNSALWIHSPVPLSPEIRAQLAELGNVQYVIAPSKTHHLFVSEWIEAFPSAKLFGAPGLQAKRPDLKQMIKLRPVVEPEWEDELEQIFFDGIPFGNETAWFHKESRTLILTDLCQWWQGNLPFAAKFYAHVTGVRNKLAMPRTVRLMIKDREAARVSSEKILNWPFERVVVAHNVIIEKEAHKAVTNAFKCLS